MMKVALCGAWHVHAVDYTKKALARDDVEVLGFYEENLALRESFHQKFPELYIFETFEELLSSDADGVIVCTSTDVHADYMVRIAEAKKDIFTEKVLALTTKECLRVKEAVEKNGVRFVISLFQKFRGGMLALKALADSGELGKINYVRFRNCHGGSICGWLPEHFFNKKECGGGAMIDLGAHGMYLIDWFLGLPETYSSAFTCWDSNPKNTDLAEDNAVTVMKYSDGAIAVSETGFVSYSDPSTLIVSGDKGYARFVNNEGAVKCTEQTEKKIVPVALPEDKPFPIDAFLAGDAILGCGMEEALHLTEMMEKAYQNRI
ncbi:MAG: Gfo/Idh/MocA family oxidoreductase [Clostridia bacterium]|nr:Gfo/Idh/MocA family oxidoreductase [Clostridia bacterium]